MAASSYPDPAHADSLSPSLLYKTDITAIKSLKQSSEIPYSHYPLSPPASGPRHRFSSCGGDLAKVYFGTSRSGYLGSPLPNSATKGHDHITPLSQSTKSLSLTFPFPNVDTYAARSLNEHDTFSSSIEDSLSNISTLDLNDSFSPKQMSASEKFLPHFPATPTTLKTSDEETRYLLVEDLPKDSTDTHEMIEAFKVFILVILMLASFSLTICQKYGSLRGIYARDLYTQGCVVLSYYDVRHASEAVRSILLDRNRAFGYIQLKASSVTRSSVVKVSYLVD